MEWVPPMNRILGSENHIFSPRKSPGSQWKQADDFSLVEVVKSQLMEDLFRTLYHGKVPLNKLGLKLDGTTGNGKIYGK